MERDDFESCLHLEDEHLRKGYNQGYADGLGSEANREDGRQVGLKLGFEVGQELGFYRGIIDVWNSAIRIDPTCFRPRVTKAIKQMEEALNQYPISDPEDELATDLQKFLRFKFKVICAALKVNLEYQGYPKPSSDSGSFDF